MVKTLENTVLRWGTVYLVILLIAMGIGFRTQTNTADIRRNQAAQQVEFERFRLAIIKNCEIRAQQITILIRLNRDWVYIQRKTTDPTIKASIRVRQQASDDLQKLQTTCQGE